MNNNNNNSDKMSIVEHMNSVINLIAEKHKPLIQEANDSMNKIEKELRELSDKIDKNREELRKISIKKIPKYKDEYLQKQENCMTDQDKYQRDQDDQMYYDHAHATEEE